MNDTTSQAGTDAFGASRKLLGSPNKSKNPVRNALDEAALKLSSVDTSLQDMTPRAIRAAGNDEWTLSTENPVFSEVNTPREHSQKTSAKNTPAKERNVTPTRSTPRSARTPGSAQKEDATVFPRSFPVKEPAGRYGLRGGLAGWMRTSSKLQENGETHLAASDASSDTGDYRGAGRGGLGHVVLMFLALILIVGVLFLVPTTSLPSSVAVPLEKFRHQATATVTSPTGANLVALANKVPQSIPRLTSTNFPLSDLRYRAASTFRQFSSGRSAIQEYKTVRQIAVAAVETPLKLMGSAIAGVGLAAVVVAAVLQLHGAMPLSTLATAFGSFNKGGGGGSLGGAYYNQNNIDLTMEEQQQATRDRKGSAARKASTRSAPPATPRSIRRLVSDDADADGSGGGGRASSARKYWRR